jgi:hypothetical protein
LSSVIELKARIAKPEAVAMTMRETSGLVTVRAKPEKRLNAKERAKANAKDGTTPATTATAKSKAKYKAESKPKTKAKKGKAAR